ncbi:MAG TPA: aminodeoxychorismate synthase component I [Solirubrobacteraceae bacterium]|nr:aminodeoxychorismate synthase component I [Solirubrobacteraceae bacterium]
MKTLLVDNYDSYTYNVFHLLAAVSGEEPIVVHNDMVSWRALSRWDFDAVVLSPGPGRPERWHDFGVCSDILRSCEIPVLGVCLGHQGLGYVLNGMVATAPMAMHGRLSRVGHVGSGLFAGIPQDFSVVRYHSLAVSGDLGPEGRVTAWTGDGVVMGIEHRRRPMWGVQFHPESIATEYGMALVENFYALARERRPARASGGRRPVTAQRRVRAGAGAGTSAGAGANAGAVRDGAGADEATGAPRVSLRVRAIAGEPSTERLFEALFGAAEHAFWLDSADAPTRLAQCSYLGTSAGAEHCVLEYDVATGAVKRSRAGASTVEEGSIFDVLDRELAARALEPPAELARGLIGGFVGYIGYECKADCGAPGGHRSDLPDALLMLANRVVAVDHTRQETYLLAWGGERDDEVESWLAEAEAAVRALLDEAPEQPPVAAYGDPSEQPPTTAHSDAPQDPPTTAHSDPPEHPVRFRCGRGREQYLADIARCQSELAAGESYEICLTDQISTTAQPEPFALYRLLRRSNPAPFAAYLKFGEVAIVSSSPERFLSVDRERRVEARPIKGTAPRSADPVRDAATRRELLRDEKTYAEHLMIVDLLRNDLGRVCEVDSVRVPELMVVEPYATVHQLVSTITGQLERERTPVECVRACFPGGSMTGAPKLRTMDIIDDIERVARGVYSGALGYFGLDGSVDLSIVIRTIVLRPGATTIGAGGAIVMQSDPQEEFEEILLKARAPMAAIAQAVTGSASPAAWTVELEPALGMAEAA